MNSSVAKIIAVTVIVVSLLATATVLSLRGASDVAQAAVFTALGTALPLVFRWLTSSASADTTTDKGGPGAATVLLVVGSVLASHAAGCSSPPPALNVENAAAVAQYEMLLLDCRNLGKEKNSYDVYEACADRVDADLCARHGLLCKDGGAK